MAVRREPPRRRRPRRARIDALLVNGFEIDKRQVSVDGRMPTPRRPCPCWCSRPAVLGRRRHPYLVDAGVAILADSPLTGGRWTCSRADRRVRLRGAAAGRGLPHRLRRTEGASSPRAARSASRSATASTTRRPGRSPSSRRSRRPRRGRMADPLEGHGPHRGRHPLDLRRIRPHRGRGRALQRRRSDLRAAGRLGIHLHRGAWTDREGSATALRRRALRGTRVAAASRCSSALYSSSSTSPTRSTCRSRRRCCRSSLRLHWIATVIARISVGISPTLHATHRRPCTGPPAGGAPRAPHGSEPLTAAMRPEFIMIAIPKNACMAMTAMRIRSRPG